MATLNFPDNPSTGDTYSDANSGFEYEWNGTVWISIESGKRSNIQEIDDISGVFNGSTTDFTLTASNTAIEPTNAQQVVISLGGVLQNVNDDYTINGSTITFTTAPADGLTFFGTYLNTYLSSTTVADNTVSTGSLSASSNYTVGGVNVTGVSTLSGLTFTGISSIAALSSSNLAVTGVGTIANVIHTKDSSGLGATIGAAVGIVTYYGDASNMTGIGMTLFPYTYSPEIGSTTADNASDIVTTWNTSIEAGSGTITIRSGSASGTVVDQFVVGTSNSITIAGNSLTLNPAADLSRDVEYFVTYPAGSIKSLGGQNQNEQLIYSFTTAPLGRKVYGWGDNANGQLGLNDVVLRSSPTQISGTTWALPVVAGLKYSLAIKNDNTLWSWGYNGAGNLGLNDIVQRSSPMQVGTDTTWSNNKFKTDQASYNGYSTMAIKTDGSLWMWGSNNYGQMGLNTQANWGAGGGQDAFSSPVQIGTDTTWNKCSAGRNYSTATKTDGTLYAWGSNYRGMLGQNQAGGAVGTPAYTNSRSSPTQIPGTTWNTVYANEMALLATKTDGTLWSWGYNEIGMLGQNQTPATLQSYSSPVQIPGTTWAKVPTNNGSDTIHFAATKTDGTLWSWGYGGQGELGLNTNAGNPESQRSSPVQVGTDTTWGTLAISYMASAAIKTDGTLWAWGYSNKGSLGINQGGPSRRSSPTQIPGTWDYISSGRMTQLGLQLDE